ncbi:MAG: hypothetical protein AAF206_20555 [Bacteroidota bacterium]
MVFFLTACGQSKDAYLNEYHSFMEEVNEDYQDYDRDDWKEKNRELETFLNETYPELEEEMSNQEKAKVFSEAVRYYVQQSGDRAIKDLEDNHEIYVEAIEEQSELILELTDEFTNSVLPELEKTLPELERIGKDFIDRLEKDGVFDRFEDKMEDFGKKMEEMGKRIEERAEERRREQER